MSANDKVASAPQPAAYLDYNYKHHLMINHPNASRRPSLASRRFSGMEAMQMARDDIAAVDYEIEDFEQQLKDNPIRAPFLNPNCQLEESTSLHLAARGVRLYGRHAFWS